MGTIRKFLIVAIGGVLGGTLIRLLSAALRGVP